MGTYCQDSQGVCWSNKDCTGDGSLCQVGVDWSLPANQVRDTMPRRTRSSLARARTLSLFRPLLVRKLAHN